MWVRPFAQKGSHLQATLLPPMHTRQRPPPQAPAWAGGARGSAQMVLRGTESAQGQPVMTKGTEYVTAKVDTRCPGAGRVHPAWTDAGRRRCSTHVDGTEPSHVCSCSGAMTLQTSQRKSLPWPGLGQTLSLPRLYVPLKTLGPERHENSLKRLRFGVFSKISF